jgi:hypothetical protein
VYIPVDPPLLKFLHELISVKRESGDRGSVELKDSMRLMEGVRPGRPCPPVAWAGSMGGSR